MKFEVKQDGEIYKVYDTTTGKSITKDIPSKEIADEIAEDFNAMSNKDFRPIGGTDASKPLPN